MSAFDLDDLEAIAKAADQSEYTARKADIAAWDDEQDQPLDAWWVDRPGWVDDGESWYYSEADARYAERMHPAVTLDLVAKLRDTKAIIEAAEERHRLYATDPKHGACGVCEAYVQTFGAGR